MKRGTILYIGGFELPDKNAAAHRVINNAKIFKKLGYKVVFIGIEKNLEGDCISEIYKNYQGFDSWSVKYPVNTIHWISYLTNIEAVKMVYKKYSDIKLIIAYNYQAFALFRLMQFCKKQNIKIAADCTEWYSTKGMNIIYKIIKGLDTFLRMRFIHKRLNGLILVSSYLENYYSKIDCIVKIPPLVDIHECKWSFEGHIPGKCLKLVYTGSPGKNKDNIGIVIETLYQLRNNKNYSLNIIGISKSDYLSQYSNHEKILDELSDKIKFHNRISHIESLAILRSSDFQIFIRDKSRLTEAGFPTKFVESVSLGIPVISTDNSDIGDYITDGVNGFLASNNLKMVLEKVLYLSKKDIEYIKGTFKKDVFDYRNYLQKVENWLCCMGMC